MTEAKQAQTAETYLRAQADQHIGKSSLPQSPALFVFGTRFWRTLLGYETAIYVYIPQIVM